MDLEARSQCPFIPYRDSRCVTRSEKSKALRDSRKARGLCTKCLQPLVAGNANYCSYHRDKANERRKRYPTNKSAEASRLSRKKTRALAMIKLGGLMCAWCDQRDFRLLQIDHIDGLNGNVRPGQRTLDRRDGRTGTDYDTWLRRIVRGEEPLTGLRVLCADCQIINEYRRGTRWLTEAECLMIKDLGGFVGQECGPST